MAPASPGDPSLEGRGAEEEIALLDELEAPSVTVTEIAIVTATTATETETETETLRPWQISSPQVSKR
ncbi:hypothetical protein COL922a_002417 [Colletotrichum nupharicola]|nr:hypothetical protein COL922a_002417 [Colletotrichum nupharicola]